MVRGAITVRRARIGGMGSSPPATARQTLLNSTRTTTRGQSLPSFAPFADAKRHVVARAGATQVATAASSTSQNVARLEQRPSRRDAGHDDIHEALVNFLNQQGRQPPSGMSGFDTRLTPAWAGRTY